MKFISQHLKSEILTNAIHKPTGSLVFQRCSFSGPSCAILTRSTDVWGCHLCRSLGLNPPLCTHFAVPTLDVVWPRVGGVAAFGDESRVDVGVDLAHWAHGTMHV